MCLFCNRTHDKNHLYVAVNHTEEIIVFNCFRNKQGNPTGQPKPSIVLDLEGLPISRIDNMELPKLEYIIKANNSSISNVNF